VLRDSRAHNTSRNSGSRPRAIRSRFNPTRCTTNPLGVKGCGDAGMVGAFPAVTNAILDALAPLGVSEIDGPATADRIRRAIAGAKAKGA
jgi:carbon-monoxide dehydrogenase large subunit